ncbi:hypothetical protein BaRGS_00019706, partial [Batillaria attramentaria]
QPQSQPEHTGFHYSSHTTLDTARHSYLTVSGSRGPDKGQHKPRKAVNLAVVIALRLLSAGRIMTDGSDRTGLDHIQFRSVWFLLLTLAGLCQALPTARDKRQAFHLVPLTSDNSTAITYDNSTGKEGSNPSPPMGLPPLGTSSGFEPQNTSQVDDDDMGNQFPDSGCINLCSLGNHCKNGGTCLFNVTTCSLHCACPEGYDPDRHCSSMGDNSSPSGVPFSNSTLRPLSQRECHGNRLFVCYHGQCLNTTEDTGLGGWLCACDPGWSGDFCTDPCTRDCGTRGTCRLDGVTREEYCSCNWPWQGVTCDDLPPPDPVVDDSKVYVVMLMFADDSKVYVVMLMLETTARSMS